MPWQRKLDARALELAAATGGRLERHEDECGNRYKVINESLNDLGKKLDHARDEREGSSRRIYGMLWKTASATIMLLLAVIGYLLTSGVPWRHL